MPGLDELRKRVEAAEQQFGLITTQSRKYSDRLTQLVSQMEQAHSEQHKEIAALNARLGQFEQENGQLKAMLLGLLQAMEDGDGSLIDNTVRDMECRIGRLIGVPEDAVEQSIPADVLSEEEVASGLDGLDGALAEDSDIIADIAPEEVMIEDDADLAVMPDDGLIELDDELVEVAEHAATADEVAADAASEESVEETDAAAAGPEASEIEASEIEASETEASEIEAPEIEVAETGPLQATAPEPETVTLDDSPEDGDANADEGELTASAHNLLDRVEAAANALLAAGADDDADPMEHELTDEISALLERAVNGTSEETDDDMAEVMLADEAEGDVPADADTMTDESEEVIEDPKANAA